MVDLKVLEKYGCTKERLQQIFTAQGAATQSPKDATDANPATPENKKPTDIDIRKRFESRIRARLLAGITQNARNSRAMQAVDMAWDAPPIQKETVPLMMWAQGKISQKDTIRSLQRDCPSLFTPTALQTPPAFLKKISGSDELELQIPRISEIVIDIMRSYITRRLASMDSLWTNLYPLWRYSPRGADSVAMLRGDILTQRVDIISDDYNYRHLRSQLNRDMLLYAWSVVFPRSSWDRKYSWQFKKTNTGEPTEETESVVQREGVDFANPHPSRICYDLSAPLANLNTDTGPNWILYWDITRYGNLRDADTLYYNLSHVSVSDGWVQLAAQYADFLAYYFDPKVLTWPDLANYDVTLWNDRGAQIGVYTSEKGDQGVLATQYFERINPKREGIGEYDQDVWMRLTVAGDCTVIGGEFMPSLPGAYGGINCNDNRIANQSMGMALLSYQDQASNIVSHMIRQIRTSLFQLWLIDKDSLDENIRKEIEKNSKDWNWWIDPQVFMYSATKLREMGITDPRTAFAVVQANVQNVVDAGLKQLAQLLNLADRLLILSPNELGQPNPREVAATEVTEISTSVQSVTSFINQAPREQTAAMKRLVYESLVVCGSRNFRVPIEGRYTVDIIRKAGFKVDEELLDKTDVPPRFVPEKTPIMGDLKLLVYDYYFDSRDGAERVLNTQGANVMMQLLTGMLKLPGIPQAMGLKDIYEFVNTIIRMSGAPTTFQLRVPEGKDVNLPLGEEQKVEALQGALQQLGARMQRMEAMFQAVARGQPPAGGAPPPGAPPAQPPPPPAPPAAPPVSPPP